MFSRSDILSLLQTAASAPDSFSRLNYIEDLTGTGIYASKHIKDKLRKFINETEERSTISEVARKFNVDQKHISQLLPQLDGSGWIQINYQIIPNKEYIKLRDFLHHSLDHELVNVVVFCRDYELSQEALDRLLSTDKDGRPLELQWLNTERTLVCSNALYKSRERLLEDGLTESSTPQDLRSIENPKINVLPYNIVLRMTNNLLKEERLQGTLNGSVYTPKMLQLSLQDQVLAELVREGVVNVKDLKRAGLDKSDSLIRKTVPTAKLLRSSFVTDNYITAVENAVMRNLNLYGYGNFKDEDQRLAPEEEIILKDNFVTRQKRKKKFHEYESMVISPELADRLSSSAIIHAENKAQTEWLARIGQRSLDHSQTISWQDSLKFSNPSISVGVINYTIETIRDKATLAYTTKYAELRNVYNISVKTDFVQKVVIPWILYLRGIDYIKDEALKEALSLSLNTSFRGIFMSELSTLEEQLVDSEEDIYNIDAISKDVVDTYEDGSKTSVVKNINILEQMISMIRAIGLEVPAADVIALQKQRMISDILEQVNTTDSMILPDVVSLLFAQQTGIEGGLVKIERDFVDPLLEELGPYLPDKDSGVVFTASKDYSSDRPLDNNVIAQLRELALRSI